MAEFVEKRLLETIDEVEEMENLGLINSIERRKLVEKRREFEYRIARRTKAISSYVSYINYEKDVLKLLQLRRKKIGQNEKRGRIEEAISSKCIKLLRFMTRRWAGKMELWSMRIEFAKSIGWLSEVSVAYKSCLSYHGTDSSVWIAWARWEIEGRQDFDKAREILLVLAPMYCPKSLPLYTEIFRLELLFVEEVQSRAKVKNIEGMEEIIAENREKVLSCGVAEIVYSNAVKDIPSPQMYIELHQVAKKFPFAKELKLQIFSDLIETFSEDKDVWRVIAQTSLSDPEDIPASVFSVMQDIKDETKTESIFPLKETIDMETEETITSSDTTTNKTMSIPDIANKLSDVKINCTAFNKIDRILFVLDTAMKKVGSSFVGCYIEELLLYLHSCWTSQELTNLIMKKIVCLCESNEEQLSLYHYIIWFVSASNTDAQTSTDKIINILDKAITKYPDSNVFQYKKFKLACETAVTDADLESVLKSMGENMQGEYGLRLWSDIVDRVSVKQKHKIYGKASLHVDPLICKHMKVKYLQWLASTKKFKKLFLKYNKIKYLSPFEAKIHSTAIYAELKKKKVSIEAIRSVFENALQQFGTTHYGLWISYIYFEKLKGDGNKSNVLRSRAHDQLEASCLQHYKNLIFDLDNCKDDKDIVGNFSLPSLNEDYLKILGLTDLITFSDLPIATYSVNKSRDSFFNSIADMMKDIENEKKKTFKSISIEEENLIWEDIINKLSGKKVFMPTPVGRKTKIKVNSDRQQSTFSLLRKSIQKYSLSDRLQCQDVSNINLDNFLNEDVDDYLQKSDVLKPEFIKQKTVEHYFKGRRQDKLKNKKLREGTTGSGWYNMKAPEMTEELQRDVDLLKMRSVLDPKQHYKGSSMKTTPKYFEVGTYVDAPEDYYINRESKRGKKRSLVEELIHNEEVLRYQKKKCKEIMAVKQKQQFRYPSKTRQGKTGKKKMGGNNQLPSC